MSSRGTGILVFASFYTLFFSRFSSATFCCVRFGGVLFFKNLLTGPCARSSGLREPTDVQSVNAALFNERRSCEQLLANSLHVGAEIVICVRVSSVCALV